MIYFAKVHVNLYAKYADTCKNFGFINYRRGHLFLCGKRKQNKCYILLRALKKFIYSKTN